MIEIHALSFRYSGGDFALSIPEFRVASAERVALIGPSGSGKTTLLNLVAGIVAPESGRVVTKDTELATLSDRERRDFRLRHIGLVFQEFEMLEYLTVFENILLPYRLGAALHMRPADRDRAGALAKRFGIGDKLDRYPDQLSQGERQRVAVCRALVVEPPLLLTDEPTGNLDPGNKTRVLDELFEYADEAQATLVTVTHDHDLLERFQRVVDFKQFHAPRGNTTPTGGS